MKIGSTLWAAIVRLAPGTGKPDNSFKIWGRNGVPPLLKLWRGKQRAWITSIVRIRRPPRKKNRDPCRTRFRAPLAHKYAGGV